MDFPRKMIVEFKGDLLPATWMFSPHEGLVTLGAPNHPTAREQVFLIVGALGAVGMPSKTPQGGRWCVLSSEIRIFVWKKFVDGGTPRPEMII